MKSSLPSSVFEYWTLLKSNPALACSVIASLLFPVLKNWSDLLAEPASFGVLFLLVLSILYKTFPLAVLPPKKTDRIGGLLFAWSLPFLAFFLLAATSFGLQPAGHALVFSLLLLAVVARFHGLRAFLWMLTPFLICSLILTFRAQILLYAAYPLRMGATVLSVTILSPFYPGLSFEQTLIRIPETEMTITDACSGIQQVEAMLLIAFWLVNGWSRPFWWKTAHYAFLLPSIVFANAVRIMTALLLYRVIGDAVLHDSWHIGLGYYQLILALVLFFFAGCFFPENKETKP